MKKTNRIVSLVLTLCMLVSLVAVLPLSVSAADTPTFNHEKYEIKNVTFVAGGSLIFGSAEDMLQWSDVDVAGYSISVYAEGGSESIHLVYTEVNYMAAANVLPYSGDFYVAVTPVNDIIQCI